MSALEAMCLGRATYVVGMVPEQLVSRIEVGSTVVAELISGVRVKARVTFLASGANPNSRSYRIEAQIDPGQGPIRDGITAELLVDAADIQAHLIPSSALLVLTGALILPRTWIP